MVIKGTKEGESSDINNQERNRPYGIKKGMPVPDNMIINRQPIIVNLQRRGRDI
jgi:hypothetical protein